MWLAGCCWPCACSPAPPSPGCCEVVWFTPVLMSYVVVGIIWVWIYDYDWGLANRSCARSDLGVRTVMARRSAHGAVVRHGDAYLEMARLQHDHLSRGAPRAAERGAGRRRARQLRLVREAHPHHHPDAAADHRQSPRAVLHRQDDDLRPGLDHDRGGPLWSTETVSTYVYKRAFDWNTFDLGYPSAIAVLWFLIILAFVVLMTQLPASARPGSNFERAVAAMAPPSRLACASPAFAAAAFVLLYTSSRAAPSCGWRSCRCARRRKSPPTPMRCRSPAFREIRRRVDEIELRHLFLEQHHRGGHGGRP